MTLLAALVAEAEAEPLVLLALLVDAVNEVSTVHLSGSHDGVNVHFEPEASALVWVALLPVAAVVLEVVWVVAAPPLAGKKCELKQFCWQLVYFSVSAGVPVPWGQAATQLLVSLAWLSLGQGTL